MTSWRVRVNLLVIFAASAALIAFGFVNLIGNPLRSPTRLVTVLPSASGLYTDFSVTLNGVDVGSVQGVTLTPKGARVVMAIDPGVTVPGDVAASVDIANALGEQQIDLVPQRGGTAAPLVSGATVPVVKGGLPADVGTVVHDATRLLDAIPPRDLNTALDQLAIALNGRASDMREIIGASRVYAEEFLAYQAQFKELLANAPPVLDAVASVGPQLRDALDNTVVLVRVLAAHRSDLVRLLDNGAAATSLLNALVSPSLPDLGCLTHDFGNVMANVAQPANLSLLATDLATNQEFFGPIDAIAPAGPARALGSRDVNRNTQEWLRTRLLIPPAQPPAIAYAKARNLPPVLPGAACSTEFGPGAPAASQPGFAAAGPGAHVIAAPASDAEVRGHGSEPGAGGGTGRADGAAASTEPTMGAGGGGLEGGGVVLAPAGAFLFAARDLVRRRRTAAANGDARSTTRRN